MNTPDDPKNNSLVPYASGLPSIPSSPGSMAISSYNSHRSIDKDTKKMESLVKLVYADTCRKAALVENVHVSRELQQEAALYHHEGKILQSEEFYQLYSQHFLKSLGI